MFYPIPKNYIFNDGAIWSVKFQRDLSRICTEKEAVVLEVAILGLSCQTVEEY
jgi:hypothetical protein